MELLGYRNSGFDGDPLPGTLCAAPLEDDVTHVLDRREAAMAEHGSQDSPYDGLSPESRRTFLSTDHVARVRPR